MTGEMIFFVRTLRCKKTSLPLQCKLTGLNSYGLDCSRNAMKTIIDSMVKELSRGNPNYLPSKFWQTLNQKNLEQIEVEGFQNFKQTVAQNYFTWVIGRNSDQFRWLVKQTSFWAWPRILLAVLAFDQS